MGKFTPVDNFYVVGRIELLYIFEAKSRCSMSRIDFGLREGIAQHFQEKVLGLFEN